MRQERNDVGINRDEMLRSATDLRERFIFGQRKHLSQEAYKHLFRGFGVRLSMIEHVVVTLDVELTKAVGPISSYRAIELTLLLNAFYIHLSGALDNLAWALGNQYQLLPDLDERNKKHRRFVGLLNAKFLTALEQKEQHKLVARLRALESWYNDLKTFRDPGAHRIPLYIPPAMLTQEHLAERKKLDEEAAQHYSSGDHFRGGETIHRMSFIGDFYPMFSVDLPEVRMYPIGMKISEDFDSFYQVATAVYEDGFGLSAR